MSCLQTFPPPSHATRSVPTVTVTVSVFQEDPPRRRKLELSDFFKDVVPPLSDTLNPKIDAKLLIKLNKLLKAKPALFRPDSSLPKESSWALPCPDGTVLRFSGFGYRKGDDPCEAVTTVLTEYRHGKIELDANEMVAAKVNAAVRSLIDANTGHTGNAVVPEPVKRKRRVENKPEPKIKKRKRKKRKA